MSRLFFAVPARARFFLLSLTLLPSLPGAVFLIAGWMCDPPLPAQDQHAAAQARVLYQAGILTLGTGALCGAMIGWQLLRRRDTDMDELR